MSVKLTATQVLDKAEPDLKSKVADLTSSIQSLRGQPQVEQVLACNNKALAVKKAMDTYRLDVLNTERPVSLADGKRALKLTKELQVSWNIVINEVIDNKTAIENLPVAKLTKLIGQSLKDMLSSLNSLGADLLDATPAEIKGEAKTCLKEFEEAINKAITVYQ